MAIANELSSDVAAAILTRESNKIQEDPKELAEIVRNFYSALRPLTTAARRRRKSGTSSSEPPSNSRAATDNH